MANDGKVVIGTELDNSGIEKDTRKMGTSLRGQAAKIAAEYRRQGMSMSDAMKKAWSEVERSSEQSSKQVGNDIKENIGGSAGAASGKLEGLAGFVKGTLGGLTKVVANVAVSIVSAFAKATVEITKQSMDAYANYEQLVGGVEMLFKGSVTKVVAYAEDAFRTTGLSANEYMETVTSFSASLISSLGGDTEKAADVANMALVDMADNANKMGSEMGAIQNAYQGFSKQNYTMLDNLKLGYGGTKTEMERLLKDAQARTGVEYDINNLADVYNAIHAIQEKLGVAGATAAEAEGTISGSAAMTAAAWKNVLTAIAGGGDLDTAINNLVYSVSKYFDNIVPVVQRALAGIGQLIEKIAPSLVQTIAADLIKAIPSLINAVYQMLVGLANGVYQGIVALFSGSAAEIAAQLNNPGATEALGGIADGYADAETAAEDAEDAAERYLAGFDEITKIGGDSNSDTGISAFTESAAASTISVGDPSDPDGGVEDNASPVVKAIIDKILELIEPLRNIDFSPALESIKGLGESFKDLAMVILDALEWAWHNILAPIIGWFFEVAIPAILDSLRGVIEFLTGVFTGDWDRAWEGIKEAVKLPANGIIGFINIMLSAVTSLVNSVIDALNTISIDLPDWEILGDVAGATLGFDFPHVTAPQIPYLAQGAVLPANKPFLAMVGDQKHGTNVEAPLSTIQEAVALVMEDMIRSNIAGHEATVAVLKEILEAVLGIHIGDDVLGQAVARYNAKMAIMRGGLA